MGINANGPKARALGAALRDARLDKGIGLRTFAAEIGRDPSLVSRWETADRVPKPTDVAQVLTRLGIVGERYDEIIELAGGADQSQWLAVSLPEQKLQLAALLDYERTATSITEVSPLLVPGLLQSSGYVRAIMTCGGVPTDEIETRIRVRLGRREVLQRDKPVRFLALVGEAALRQVVGSQEVMVEQLRHLLWMAEVPNVELRVVPFRSGWHAALEGAFILIESDELQRVVHLENRRSALFLHEDEDVEIYRHAVDTVSGTALGATESALLIASEIDRMEMT